MKVSVKKAVNEVRSQPWMYRIIPTRSLSRNLNRF